ncbi:MAG: hypothetical protein NZ891_03650, partial [bacterium]|nr:hypothetical protein [bacterium]MDW8163819.1 lipid II flippase MurJ [Candidatus Omnitrophota bacterium]
MVSILSIFNFLGVLLSLIFQFLLVRYFGISFFTDLYYLLTGLVMFLSTTPTSFILGLYIPIYNEMKVKDKANEFTGALFFLIFFISTFISIIIFFFPELIIKIFASGFDLEKVRFASEILRILSLYPIFDSLSLLLNFTLQANFYMILPFFMRILTPFFSIISLLFFADIYGIKAVIFAKIFSSFFSFLIFLTFLLLKIPIKFTNPFSKIKEIWYLFKNSFTISLSGIIWDLKSPITTNVLSYFEPGYLTLFNYANRILNIFTEIINSPFLGVFYIEASKYISENNIKKIKERLILILRTNILLFIILLSFSLIIFKKFFLLIFYPKVLPFHIDLMYKIFLILIPYYSILIFESFFVR